MNDTINHICRLCSSDKTEQLNFAYGERQYCFCSQCHLIFADQASLPDYESERQRYEMHQNHLHDTGYIRFLQQLLVPLANILSPAREGLDYGCGPEPVLAHLIRSQGYKCEIYDPIFFPELQPKDYDFITATECIEHFHFPSVDFDKISKMLRQEGILALMTDTWQSIEKFGTWHYIRDFTHVCFYNILTMSWLAEKYGMSLIYTDSRRVFIFRKTKTPDILVSI